MLVGATVSSLKFGELNHSLTTAYSMWGIEAHCRLMCYMCRYMPRVYA